MKGKLLLLLAAAVVLVAGVVAWPDASARAELSPARVEMHSESLSGSGFRWCFNVDDEQGEPLETVFYTEEWTPADDGGAVEVTVRLFDAPAAGRTPLRRVQSEESASCSHFVLTCVCPSEVSAQYPRATFRINFCGRSLGSWQPDSRELKAVALDSLD